MYVICDCVHANEAAALSTFAGKIIQGTLKPKVPLADARDAQSDKSGLRADCLLGVQYGQQFWQGNTSARAPCLEGHLESLPL